MLGSIRHLQSLDTGATVPVRCDRLSRGGSSNAGRGSGGGGGNGGLVPDCSQFNLDLRIGGMRRDATLPKCLSQMTATGELSTALVIFHQYE